MPSVTTKGQVTIPKAVREAMGIKPGDEVVFEKTDEGYVIQKDAPTTDKGADPFQKYRGIADSGATMPERMRRLRGEYPREIADGTPTETDETVGGK
ncbi:AbrB/MazE/SpoVT family DNA-binding domain-containing protein [Halococcus agarilyticus]|uniref:AbrB/MazE/SpoVT family DNA-binding domain-containing protein n=1 Tax=Halococcus agarilyticus TaxID=1232219 RepID=UPI0006777B80|nr:AbrB/MazE/SpoVT family DNA-binding domain-containing protein [Halococcus agarilyticus]